MDFEQWCQENTDIKKLSKSLNSSSPEQYVGFYLSKIFDDIEYQKQFDWLKNYSLDIYIPSLKLVIEYDGLRYHCDRTSDAEKTSLCQSHDLTIFRIIEFENDGHNPTVQNSKEAVSYIPDKRYRNINITIENLFLLINKKFGKNVLVDVDLNRDKKEILTYVQTKYYQKSIAKIWPEVVDYWDNEKNAVAIFDVLCTNQKRCYQLKCPHCGKPFILYMRYCYANKALIPCECEYKEIEKNLMLEIKNYRENGTLIAFDNSLYSRRLYDKINIRIKYFLSIASKEELELYKKLGFESSVLDDCLAQYIDE